MTLKFVAALAAFAVLATMGGSANAAIAQADFRSELDLPDFSAAGPRVLERTGVGLPNPGFELEESDEISNPAGWGDALLVDLDPAANVLTLLGSREQSYQTITVAVTNIVFGTAQRIVGVTQTASGATSLSDISISFTDTSILISYLVTGGLGNDTLFTINRGGFDTFAIALAPIPLPGAAPFLLVGLAGLGALRRRDG